MASVFVLVLGLMLVACGGEDSRPDATAKSAPSSERADGSQGTDNRPPQVNRAEIVPREPKAGEALTVSVDAIDPDHDQIQIEVEWYRNNAFFERSAGTSLDGTELRRGDTIKAVVHITDGRDQVSVPAGAVTVVNQLPQVRAVRLIPEEPTGNDALVAAAEAFDPDGDSYDFEFAWFINDEPVAGANDATLEAGRLKRGDTVRVSVAARDREGAGDRVLSTPIEVRNAAPEIVSNPGFGLSGPTTYEYAVKSRDPDGDRPLRYRLVKAPHGMRIDLLSGVLRWDVPTDVDGKYDIELAVTDPYGGETRQSYVLELSWEDQPAAPR